MKLITDNLNRRTVQIGVFSSLLVFGLASGPLSAQQNPGAQQQQPQGQVEQSQQPPEASGQREGQPQVQVEQPKGQEQVGAAPAMPGEEQQPAASQQPAHVAQLQQMKDKSLYSQSGEELGKIDELARDKTTGQTVAIVSTGGFLGVGGERVAMPIEDIQIQGDRAVTTSVSSKEELKQMATAGTEQYEKLEEGESQRG